MSENDTNVAAEATEEFVVPEKEEQIGHYETLILVAGGFSDEEAQTAFAFLKEQVQAFGGELTYEEVMGRRNLAYSVEGSNNGTYFVVEFDMNTQQLAGFNEKLRIRKDIARFLTVKKRKKTPEDLAKEAEQRKKREEHKAKKMIEHATETAQKAAKEQKVDKAPKQEVAAPEKPQNIESEIDKALEDNMNA